MKNSIFKVIQKYFLFIMADQNITRTVTQNAVVEKIQSSHACFLLHCGKMCNTIT